MDTLLIILGLIALSYGLVFYISGNELNNDIDAQMESLFGSGKTNPGSEQITVGIVLIVVGILMILIGVYIKYNKKTKSQTQNHLAPSGQTRFNSDNSKFCEKCGALISKKTKFCVYCGEKSELICKNCGEVIDVSMRFCPHCAEPIKTFKNNNTEEHKVEFL